MKKVDKSVSETYTSLASALDDAKDSTELLQHVLHRLADSTMTYSMPDPSHSVGSSTPASGFTPVGGFASTSTAFQNGYAIERIEKLVEEIYKNTITSMSHLESIEFLTQVLENRKCPTDDCKKCRYYMPGNVDKCDTNRMLAEYLVNGEFVKAIRPKPIDKPKES